MTGNQNLIFVSQNCDLRFLGGFYLAQNGSLLPMFQDNLSAPFSRDCFRRWDRYVFPQCR